MGWLPFFIYSLFFWYEIAVPRNIQFNCILDEALGQLTRQFVRNFLSNLLRDVIFQLSKDLYFHGLVCSKMFGKLSTQMICYFIGFPSAPRVLLVIKMSRPRCCKAKKCTETNSAERRTTKPRVGCWAWNYDGEVVKVLPTVFHDDDLSNQQKLCMMSADSVRAGLMSALFCANSFLFRCPAAWLWLSSRPCSNFWP